MIIFSGSEAVPNIREAEAPEGHHDHIAVQFFKVDRNVSMMASWQPRAVCHFWAILDLEKLCLFLLVVGLASAINKKLALR